MAYLVAIYLYDEMEVLDFAGPFEVFTTASRLHRRDHPVASPLFEVVTVGLEAGPVTARGGLTVIPSRTTAESLPVNVLVIPGGIVTAELDRPATGAWIRRVAERCEIVASVCTGAFLLARAGVLCAAPATTHWEDLADLQAMFPDLDVRSGVRWIDNGKVITSAGISAGIDMSLHLVSRLAGIDLARRTARQMDFDWMRPDPPPDL